jgi:hypothetical protein
MRIALMNFTDADCKLNAFAGGEMKKVCHPDAKAKKEVCKTIKVHKKLEGTKVPTK